MPLCRRLAFALATLVFAAPSPPALAAPPRVAVATAPQEATSLAERLVALRSDVESLSADLTLLRTQAKEDLRLHGERQRDLESERTKEELRLARVTDAMARLTADRQTHVDNAAALGPSLRQVATALRAHVHQSMPFRRSDRIAVLTAFIADLDDNAHRAASFAPRLYTLVQDEKRLTEDSERVRLTLEVDGEHLLVDAVRLGMVTLFFRTDDGRVGRVFRPESATTWTTEVLTAAPDKEHIETLLDAFGKQIRTGWFELPLALPAKAASDAIGATP